MISSSLSTVSGNVLTSNTGDLAISVIVPVRNEAAFIQDTLRQILDQEYPQDRFEILVVDGCSTDGTQDLVREVAEEHANVRLLENPARLSSAARNIGIKNSQGDVVLIVDGHCEIPSRQMLRNVSDAFITTGADCLGRPQPQNVENATTLQKAIGAARASRLGHHPESFIYSDQPQFAPAKSVAVAYRRNVFDRVGCFDERFDAHEDGELNYRCDAAGLRCYFTPAIAVHYFARASLLGLFRQMVRYGRGRVKFSRKHPGTWGLGALIPALFVLYVILGVGLAAAVPSLALAYGLGLAVYAAAVATSSAAVVVKKQEPLLLIWLPVVFIIIHMGAGVGLLAELLCRKLRNA